MIPNEPGIYYDVPFSDYVQIDAVNHSLLWEMENRSPLHARWKQDHPQEDTPAMRIGRAAHALILEPETFEQRWAVAPDVDRRTKAGKESYAQFVDGSGDRDVITAAEFESIQEMAKAIEGQRLHKLVRTGKADFLAQCRQHAPEAPLTGPLSLQVGFLFARPKNHYRTGKRAGELKENRPIWHTSRPDTDNLLKLVKDAMNGVFYRDDCQVVTVTASKIYSDAQPFTTITLRELSNETA